MDYFVDTMYPYQGFLSVGGNNRRIAVNVRLCDLDWTVKYGTETVETVKKAILVNGTSIHETCEQPQT